MSENLTVDPELGEALQKNEEQLTQRIAAVQRDGIRLQGQGEMREVMAQRLDDNDA